MISIDNRAGSKDLFNLGPLASSSSSSSSLPVELISFDDYGLAGDVTFDINGPNNKRLSIGIEVKKHHDLLGSISSARLHGQGDKESNRGQLIRMLDHYDIVYLVWYGNVYAGDGNKPYLRYATGTLVEVLDRIALRRYKKPRESLPLFDKWLSSLSKTLTLGNRKCYWNGLYAALSSIQLRGINVTHVNSLREVALYIACLYNWGSKPWHKHSMFSSINMSSNADRSSMLALQPNINNDVITRAKMMNALSGIGLKRSIEVALKYNSIQNMIADIAANPNALLDVASIGMAKSIDIHKRITTQYDDAGNDIGNTSRGVDSLLKSL